MNPETVLVEFLDVRGRTFMHERVTLNDEKRTLTIGRSVNAEVTVDDEHVAPLHASLEITPEGHVLATDLGSTNGIVVSGKRYHAVQQLVLSSRELQVGRTRLRVRTVHEALSPEKADLINTVGRFLGPAWLAAAGALAVTGQLAYTSWLQAPPDLAASMASLFGAMAILLGLWVFLWALLSRVMRAEWRWLQHVAIGAGALALYVGVDSLLDIAAYMLSLPMPERNIMWLGALALGGAVCLHLVHASSLSMRRSARLAAIAGLIVLAGSYWMAYRPAERDVNYVPSRIRLYPPVLRLSTSWPVDAYYKTLAGLRESADEKVKAAIAADPNPDDGMGAIFGGQP